MSKLACSIWTENNDNNMSGMEILRIDGKMDTLGSCVTLSDYHDELCNNNNNDNENQNASVQDGNELSLRDFARKKMIPNELVLIKNMHADWRMHNDWASAEDDLTIEHAPKTCDNDIVPAHTQSK